MLYPVYYSSISKTRSHKEFEMSASEIAAGIFAVLGAVAMVTLFVLAATHGTF